MLLLVVMGVRADGQKVLLASLGDDAFETHGTGVAKDGSAIRALNMLGQPDAVAGLRPPTIAGAVRNAVGIESGVVSGVINLESPGVRAPGWRPRHDKRYHEA